MAMKIYRTKEGVERWDKNYNPTEYEIKYLAVDPTDKSSAMRAAFDDAPDSYVELAKSGVRSDGYDKEGNLEISVLYSGSDSTLYDTDEESEPTVSFNCSGGTEHITHAISQKKVYPSAGGDDMGGAIGLKPSGEITGIDILTGQLRESYTKTMRMSSITTSKKRAWNSLVGKVNNASFKGWEAGEVMFLGCSFSGTSKKSSSITVQFNFSIQQNEADAKVNGISCGAKKGFEAIWAYNKDRKKENNRVSEIAGIYVSTVCKSGNFGILGI